MNGTTSDPEVGGSSPFGCAGFRQQACEMFGLEPVTRHCAIPDPANIERKEPPRRASTTTVPRKRRSLGILRVLAILSDCIGSPLPSTQIQQLLNP